MPAYYQNRKEKQGEICPVGGKGKIDKIEHSEFLRKKCQKSVSHRCGIAEKFQSCTPTHQSVNKFHGKAPKMIAKRLKM